MRKTTVAINIHICAGVYKNKTLLNFRSGGFTVEVKRLLSNSFQKDLLDLYSLHRYIPLESLQKQSNYEVIHFMQCHGKSYLTGLNTKDIEEIDAPEEQEKRVREEYRIR
jgi:hypothetical protein